MEGFAVSLRLPEAPVPAAAPAEGGARPEVGDGVFVRLMSLPKGKTLTARALRLVYPPPEAAAAAAGEGGGGTPKAARAEGGAAAVGSGAAGGGARADAAGAAQPPNLRVVWAVMRNLRSLFSGKAATLLGRGDKVRAGGAGGGCMPRLLTAQAAALT